MLVKICLIHTPVEELKDDRLDPPMGLLYLGSWLKTKANADYYDVSIVDLSGVDAGKWQMFIPVADWYGFSTYTPNYHVTLGIKKVALSVNPNALTIAGGPHATAMPNEVAKDFDYVVVGDGEVAIGRIINNRPLEKIHKEVPLFDADHLPYVDYELVGLNSYHRIVNGQKRIPIFSSRGCPYRCSFCTSKTDQYGRYLRQRSVPHFVGEIKQILEKYHGIGFRIKDDYFGSNVKWMLEFARECPPINYDCLLRANYSPLIPEILKTSGCDMVSMGLESGSGVILQAMHKGNTAKQNRLAVLGLKDVGIKVLTWIIVGFPGETWDTVKETVDMLNESAPDIYTVYPLIPYPGTDVYNNRDKYGLRIIDNDFSHYFYIMGDYEAGYVYETDTLSPSLIKDMKQYIIENVTESALR